MIWQITHQNPGSQQFNLNVTNVGSGTAVHVIATLEGHNVTLYNDPKRMEFKPCDICASEYVIPRDTKIVATTISELPEIAPMPKFNAVLELIGQIHYQDPQGNQYFRNVCLRVDAGSAFSGCIEKDLNEGN